MGIGRQKEREQITPAINTAEKIVIKHSDHPELSEEQFLEKAVQKFHEIIKPEQEAVIETASKEKTEKYKIHVTNEVEKEEIELLKTKVRKEREDKKEVNNLALVGDTIEARDFRAICKKNNVQINVALQQMLTDWNMAHYNL